jgi:hypothetical protein
MATATPTVQIDLPDVWRGERVYLHPLADRRYDQFAVALWMKSEIALTRV